jgi:asparagine synthase (glutamine-hydrolysing)
MCGIHGAINFSVKESLKAITHRGPDFQCHEDFSANGYMISIGHTRLSIVDLSEAGNQPMWTEDGMHVIVFNGEIYNHKELRAKLSRKTFKGHSDTETILYYIKEFGIESVTDFNGIFALAYFNKETNKMHLVRDPFGVKPLYYYANSKELVFSSEVKPIHEIGIKKELDRELLSTFLRLRYLPSPYTLFKGIKKVEPGEHICIDLSTNKDAITYKSNSIAKVSKIDRKITKEEALLTYEDKLLKAVDRQLMSDVPISFLLSGGVDSALLAKLIKHDSNYDITCYSAGYDIRTDIDEIEDAAHTAKTLGLKQKKVILSEAEFLEQLPKLIDIIEEPLGSQSIFPIFYLTESIHNDNFKVAISGQGIDEPMGGYRKYRAQNFIRNVSKLPLSGVISKMFSNVKNDDLRRIFKSINAGTVVNQIKESTSFFDEQMLNHLFNNKQLVTKDISEVILYNRVKTYDIEDKNVTEIMMNLDTRMNLPDDLLLYTDKISMRNSIELRVPFLDLDLVSYLETLPYDFKVNINKNKILHKRLSEKHLPAEIVHRKKKGFYTPRKIWFKEKVGDHFIKEITEDRTVFSELFNKKYILDMFEQHRQGKVNYEKQLYLLIVLFLWVRQNFA